MPDQGVVVVGEGRETEFMALPGWARTQASSPRKAGRAEREVAPRDRGVVGLLEGGAVVGPRVVAVGVGGDDFTQLADRRPPRVKELLLLGIGRVRDLLQLDVRAPGPERNRRAGP